MILEKDLLSFLEGSADGFRAACGTAGTYCNLICCAISVAIVVYAILNVAANSLDMLLRAALLGRSAFFVLIHFYSSLLGDDNIINPLNCFIQKKRR